MNVLQKFPDLTVPRARQGFPQRHLLPIRLPPKPREPHSGRGILAPPLLRCHVSKNVNTAEMSPNLTDQDRAELARIIRDVIEAERYPFSPKVRRLKEVLA